MIMTSAELTASPTVTTTATGFFPPLVRTAAQQRRSAADFLRERWRFCAGFSFAIMLLYVVRLVDIQTGPVWEILLSSVGYVWLLYFLPGTLVIAVGVGLLNRFARAPLQLWLATSLLVMLCTVGFQGALQFVRTGDGPLSLFGFWQGATDAFRSIQRLDVFNVFIEQTTSGLLFFGLIAWFYLRVQVGERTDAALRATQLAAIRGEQQVVHARLSALQAQVDPDFLFAALSQVQTAYARNVDQAQAALDEVIVFLRAALPQTDASDTTFASEAALAQAALRLASRIADKQVLLQVAPAEEEVQSALCPPQVCLPLVQALHAHAAANATLQLRGSVVDERVLMRLTATLATGAADEPLAITGAVNGAQKTLQSVLGASASIVARRAGNLIHLYIGFPYASRATSRHR